MAHRAAVFSSYRRLYRARISLFRGDDEAMRQSRQSVRAEYLRHGDAALKDATHFQSLLGMADEAADMLRHSIVRGNLNQKTGHYEVKLKANHIDQNTGATGQPPLVEPITADVVARMEQKPPAQVVVETTKASASSS